MSQVQITKKGIWEAGGVIPNPNLLLNGDFHARYSQTTGWDTSVNGTTLATSWGGYNGGVSNPSTGYHAHLYLLNGEYVYRYVNENGRWLGVSQGGLQSKMAINTSYTFTIDQFIPTDSTNYIWGGLYYYKTGATSAGFHLGSFSGSGKEKGKWTKIVYHFTTASDTDLTKNVSWYIYGYAGSGTVYMKNPKLEIGTKVTPFALNTTETYDAWPHGFVEASHQDIHLYDQEYIEAKCFYEI